MTIRKPFPITDIYYHTKDFIAQNGLGFLKQEEYKQMIDNLNYVNTNWIVTNFYYHPEKYIIKIIMQLNCPANPRHMSKDMVIYNLQNGEIIEKMNI